MVFHLVKKKTKTQASSLAVLILIGMLLGGVYGNQDDVVEVVVPEPTCLDGIDNDSDGLTDSMDPECDPMSPDYDDDENGNA